MHPCIPCAVSVKIFSKEVRPKLANLFNMKKNNKGLHMTFRYYLYWYTYYKIYYFTPAFPFCSRQNQIKVKTLKCQTLNAKFHLLPKKTKNHIKKRTFERFLRRLGIFLFLIRLTAKWQHSDGANKKINILSFYFKKLTETISHNLNQLNLY